MVSFEQEASVRYRASRGLNDPGQPSQRWTVYGDKQQAVYDPIPSYRIRLEPPAKPVELQLNWETDDIPYDELDWPVYETLPIADAVLDFHLWKQCYLRWIPVLDIRGGGQPPVYFNHCSLVNDILSLEAQIDRLQFGEADSKADDLNAQRFVTMSDHSQSTPFQKCSACQVNSIRLTLGQGSQVTLSSFHPFVQQSNDSALSFGEWEIVPSPLANASYGRTSESEIDSESVVAE